MGNLSTANYKSLSFMKKIPLIFLLIALIFQTVSSAYAKSDHTPRDGDRLHPGIADSGSLILSVRDSSRTVLLDPSAISFGDDLDAFTYIDSDTISYVQFATKHRFLLRGDTLSYIGYENRATDFRLDSPAIAARFPLEDGNVTRDVWTGHMLQYGSMILKHVKGESGSVAERGWTLTDGTDTIRNATRLRWTLDMAYANPDSIDASLPDSIASELISDIQVDVRSLLSERLITERSFWFAESARYPILTDIRVSRVFAGSGIEMADTVPISMLAMYYPASFQYSDTGEEIIGQQPDGKNVSDPYGVCEDADHGNSLKIGEPETSGGSVAVTLSSQTGTCTVTITLFTDSGIRLTEPKEVTLSTVPQQCTVNVPAGWTGVVLLRVDSGDESYTRKVIL